MSHIIFWFLGFGTLWLGLKLFDDEALLIVAMLVGSVLVVAGLLTSPFEVQIGVEVLLLLSLFYVCMECIKRGDRSL